MTRATDTAMLGNIKRWRDDGYKHIYGGDLLQTWCRELVVRPRGPVRILDIGCGDGRDLLAMQRALDDGDVELYGIECTESLAMQATVYGVRTATMDLERGALPFDDNYFDLVVANQVLEHLKNWIWALNEQFRVLKTGAVAIVGVPNLAALHNRALVLLGRQPTCMKADGPHVRGFTLRELVRVMTSVPGIQPIRTGGAYMYGFPPRIGVRLGALFPSLSATVFLALRKNAPHIDFLSVLDGDTRFETNYFIG